MPHANSTSVAAPGLHLLRKLGYRWVACIIAIYAYIAVGPALTGRLLAVLERPALLVRLLGVLGSEPVRTVVLTLAFGAMWLAWALAVLRWPKAEFSTRRIWIGGIIFTLLLLPMPPHFSDDLYGYAQHGRTLAHYGLNPYTHTLRELGDSWVQHRTYWSAQPSPYGPILTLVHGAANWIGGDNFWAVVGLLKLTMAACFLLTAWFVQKIAGRVAPQEAGRALFFFLWNPLLLLELPGQGHNDAVMVALAMGGLWLITRQRHAAGFVAIFSGFLTKITAAIFLPLHWALLLRRRSWRPMIVAGVACLALTAFFWVWFFREPASLNGLRDVSSQAWLSPTWLGGELLRRSGWELEAARRIIQLPLTLAFGIFVLWRMTRVADEKSLLRECGFVMLFFLLVCTNQQNIWYATLLVPLAAVVRHPLTRSAAIAISLWPAIMYFRPFLYQPSFAMNALRMALLYAVAATGLLYGWRALRAQHAARVAESRPPAITLPEFAAADSFEIFDDVPATIPRPHEIPTQDPPSIPPA